jgi:hypothetical protein
VDMKTENNPLPLMPSKRRHLVSANVGCKCKETTNINRDAEN